MTLYRVTAQSLEVLAASAANIRVTAQSLEVLVATYEQRVMKAQAYAVLTSTGDRIAVQKSVGYAVLDNNTLATTDPYYSNTVLLCHFNGVNGATSTTDSSPSAHTPVNISSGHSSVATAQSKFGGSSLLVSDSLGYCIIQNALTDFQFGAGQFTVEAWVYFTSYSSGNISVVAGNYAGSSNLGWDFGQVSGSLAFYYSTTGTNNANVGAAWTPTLNTWYHVAADRDSSNVLRVYLNGAIWASATVASTLFASTANLYIGNDGNLGRNFTGYIDDLRVTKGIARYAGSFTPHQVQFPDSAPVVVSSRRRPVVAICG